MRTVRPVEAAASNRENRNASMAPGWSCTVVKAPRGVMPVTAHSRSRAKVIGNSPNPMTKTTAIQWTRGTPANLAFHSSDTELTTQWLLSNQKSTFPSHPLCVRC